MNKKLQLFKKDLTIDNQSKDLMLKVIEHKNDMTIDFHSFVDRISIINDLIIKFHPIKI